MAITADTIISILPGLVTTLFLVVILSYYVLFFLKQPQLPHEKNLNSITIIIPAHNEEQYIDEAIGSVIAACFPGKKQIIVVDDGSKDKTYEKAKHYEKHILLLQTNHVGKSAAMNKALEHARGEIIAIVDGDSWIHPTALEDMSKELERSNVAAACGVVRVHNRQHFFGMWSQIEQLYNSLIRFLLTRVGANIVTPGPLSMYRKNALDSVGGFSTDGFSEDIDVTVRLIRKGYRVGMSKTAIAETNMPYKTKEFLRQRFRFARGAIKLFKKHLQLSKKLIDVYTFPIFVFGYTQAVIMGLFTLYNIINGYYYYFIIKGEQFTEAALYYFLDWFSIIGFIKWLIKILQGLEPLTFIAIIGLATTILSYFLYFKAIAEFDKRFDILHLFPLFFMPPFWLLIMIIYVISLPELLRKNQYNKWKKNE